MIEVSATKEFVAHEFAEAVKKIVRASLSTDPYESNKWQAAQHLRHMRKLLQGSEEPVPLSAFVDAAVLNLRAPETKDDYSLREQLKHIAFLGAKLHLELSCDDNAARGRQSQWSDALLRAIDEFVRERERR